MAGIAKIEFIIFDKSRGRRAYADVRTALSGREFDIALCMHASMRANFLCRIINAPIRLGFDRRRARDLQWLFTNRQIPAATGEHALEAMMSFATAIGAQTRCLRWDIPLDESTRQFAAQYAGDSRPLVVVSPCSSQRSRNFRNWSVASYATIIQHLGDKGCRVVLTGGQSVLERDYGQALAVPGTVDNLVGKTSLKQLAALIDVAAFVICPDSGPAHMATAFGTPVLGLYATSNPDRTGPFLSRETTVNRYPDAAIRYLGKAPERLKWGQRVRHPDAMDLITIGDVTSNIDAFFDI